MLRFFLLSLICLGNVWSYKFDQVHPWASSCWMKVRYTPTVDKCFMESDPAIRDMTSEFPGVGFNPLNVSRLLGLKDAKYYKDGTYQLQDKVYTLVQTYGLDLDMARSVIYTDISSKKIDYDSYDTNLFVGFCAVRKDMRPALNCLIDTITEEAIHAGCDAASVSALLSGLEISLMNWDMYLPFCQEFFQCASDPVNECRKELYKADISQSISTVETMCFMMPNFDTENANYYSLGTSKQSFKHCIHNKTQHCDSKVQGRYEDVIGRVMMDLVPYMRTMDVTREMCEIIDTLKCHLVQGPTTPAPMETMNKRRKKRTSYVQKGVFDMKTRSADARMLLENGTECFEGIYAEHMASEKSRQFLSTLSNWRSVSPRLTGENADRLGPMCKKIFLAETCISDYLLRNFKTDCAIPYETLMTGSIGPLITGCDHYLAVANPVEDMRTELPMDNDGESEEEVKATAKRLTTQYIRWEVTEPRRQFNPQGKTQTPDNLNTPKKETNRPKDLPPISVVNDWDRTTPPNTLLRQDGHGSAPNTRYISVYTLLAGVTAAFWLARIM